MVECSVCDSNQIDSQSRGSYNHYECRVCGHEWDRYNPFTVGAILEHKEKAMCLKRVINLQNVTIGAKEGNLRVSYHDLSENQKVRGCFSIEEGMAVSAIITDKTTSDLLCEIRVEFTPPCHGH